jgi:hypothetical protein
VPTVSASASHAVMGGPGAPGSAATAAPRDHRSCDIRCCAAAGKLWAPAPHLSRLEMTHSDPPLLHLPPRRRPAAAAAYVLHSPAACAPVASRSLPAMSYREGSGVRHSF